MKTIRFLYAVPTTIRDVFGSWICDGTVSLPIGSMVAVATCGHGVCVRSMAVRVLGEQRLSRACACVSIYKDSFG